MSHRINSKKQKHALQEINLIFIPQRRDLNAYTMPQLSKKHTNLEGVNAAFSFHYLVNSDNLWFTRLENSLWRPIS